MAIGTIKSLSHHTDNRIVTGTNGFWDRKIQDILYDYFYKNVNISIKGFDKTFFFIDKNNPAEDIQEFHVYVLRNTKAGHVRLGINKTAHEETYEFNICAKTGDIGEVFPTLQDIEDEIHRIFLHEYVDYSIAGIHQILGITSGQLNEPINETGDPYNDVWRYTVNVTISYSIFMLEIERQYTYTGQKYAAGSFVDDYYET